jgi:hypothetical protein
MLAHGYTPHCLSSSTIMSIPNDLRGNTCCSDNYRGITFCSSIVKVFGIVLIQKEGNKLGSSDMQFAYKEGHSTTMATSVLKETVKYYLQRHSNVYCCFLDATKAFDRIIHDLLFRLLLERHMDPFILRLIMESYKRQKIQTKWQGAKIK